MIADEPLPGPSLTLHRGTKRSIRWRVTRQGRPVKLDTEDVSRVDFLIAEEIGAGANVVLTLSSSDPDQIEIDPEDSSYFTTKFTATQTALLTRDVYAYGAFLYDADDQPEVLLLPAAVFVKAVIGP